VIRIIDLCASYITGRYIHSPMRRTLPMFYATLRLSTKIGRVCINNQKLESYFTALRRGDSVRI